MILDGKALSQRILAELRTEVAAHCGRGGAQPTLATVLVGEDPASAVYVRNKIRACGEVGFASRHHALPATTTEAEVLALVGALAADPVVHGILVQLPLPADIDSAQIIAAIPPEKDVDGFHTQSIGALVLKKPGFVSCTPAGILRLLQESGIDPAGRRAVVVGRSSNVGLPAALLLLHAHATVTVVHSRTPIADLARAVSEADIVVAAVGRPRFVRGEWIKEGAVVIDVGINRVEEGGKSVLVGDVDFDGAAPRAAAITPVPGGVGPMTIAMLMVNTWKAARAGG